MKAITTLLVVCVLTLLAFGMVMIYSVSPVNDSTRFLGRQVIACVLGLGAALVAARMDYRRWRPWAWWLLGLAIVMLALVLIPGIGYKANGARRWFRVLGFQFQPSDFAKLALLIALAHYGAHCQRLMRGFRRGVLIPGLMLGVVMGLMFKEPDWGTALLLAAVSCVVLLVAGVRWRYLLPPLLGGMAAVAVMLALNPVRSDRVYSWFHLEETKDAVGYQVWQSWLALGSGGATGKGLNQSTQKPFIPEHRTDFIFAVVGEEFGFAGSVAVIAAFVTLFVCGLAIAWRAPDPFGLLLGTGISFLIAMQAFINIAVVSNALPNKGLALPFISYGGSNLMMMLWCAGVLVSIARGAEERSELETDSLVQPNLPFTQLA